MQVHIHFVDQDDAFGDNSGLSSFPFNGQGKLSRHFEMPQDIDRQSKEAAIAIAEVEYSHFGPAGTLEKNALRIDA